MKSLDMEISWMSKRCLDNSGDLRDSRSGCIENSHDQCRNLPVNDEGGGVG